MLPQKVFLSHSNKDKHNVLRLALDLRQAGVAVWLDEWEIRVGDSIVQKLQAGLKESQFLAIWLTHNSVNSGWVQREWQTTFLQEIQTGTVTILPLLAEECNIPVFLRDKKFADFRKDYKYGLKELLAVFKKTSMQTLYAAKDDLTTLSLEYFNLDFDLSFYERKAITAEQYEELKEAFERDGLREEFRYFIRPYELEYERQHEEKDRLIAEIDKRERKGEKVSFELLNALESINKAMYQHDKKIKDLSKERKGFLEERFHRIYAPGTPMFIPKQNMGPAKAPVFLITVFNANTRKIVLHTIELEVIKFTPRRSNNLFGLGAGETETITPLAMYDIDVPCDMGSYKTTMNPQIGVAAGDIASLHVRLVPLYMVSEGDYSTLNLKICGSNTVAIETGPFHIAFPTL